MGSPKNILITGGSGLIGTRLMQLLPSLRRSVFQLGRSVKSGNSYVWDINKGILDPDALQNKDAIIHLAGASVGDERWTAVRKIEILKSRTESTRLLFEHLKKGGHNIRHFISASAIGYYGFENEIDWHTEDSPSGKDFLAQVTRAWEEQVDKISQLGIRVVKLRIGIVLSAEGGALKEIANPVKFFVGAPLGSGRQPVSWIHIDDVCGIFFRALEDTGMSGAYNVVAPNPVDNKTLTKAIGKALGRPVILPPVPAFVLKLIIGEMAEIVVTGSKISPQKIIDAGYQFKFTNVQSAVDNLLKRNDQ
jgi:uncharacterized protein (TIGR01777 family)